MSVELNLRFPDPRHIIVRWGDLETEKLNFRSPLDAKERKDLTWYLETYAAHYTTTEDDAEAARIAATLPVIGRHLAQTAFSDPTANAYFQNFLQTAESGRLLTISANHPAILGLPWELLHTPEENGRFLLDEAPPIAVRRRMEGQEQTEPPAAKENLHLLFIISRPSDAGFIAPRADATAVLDAIETYALGRVTVEFLRPATYRTLKKRLEDASKPKVDILHFDGHGVFDERGDMGDTTPQTGYLLFEQQNSKPQLVAVGSSKDEGLGALLNKHGVALMVLSACQSAAYASNEQVPQETEQNTAQNTGESGALGSVAAGLITAGIRTVLAMSHSVLVPTTGRLFGRFYQQLAQGRGVGESLDAARQYLRDDARRRQVLRGSTRQWLQLQDWCVPNLYQSGDDTPLLQQVLQRNAEIAPTVAPQSPAKTFFGREWDLLNLERFFTNGKRCVTITGFAGQGKTELAEEAGRWLQRTGMFEVVERVSPATLDDSTSSERLTALREVPSLLILDDIENLPASLTPLLEAANATASGDKLRLLVTARPQGFRHPQLESIIRQADWPLSGLESEAALDLFQTLYAPQENLTPPDRDALKSLFERVAFHPPCVRVLSHALNEHPLDYVEEHWQDLLLADTKDNPRAAVEDSIAKLDPELRDKWLPLLGVFQGVVLESSLLDVTQFHAESWGKTSSQLLSSTLTTNDNLDHLGIVGNLITFHPMLQPILTEKLSFGLKNQLAIRHCERYSKVAEFLYFQDQRNPTQARILARLEIRNLRFAIQTALDEETDYSIDFANAFVYFLEAFGFSQEQDQLIQRISRTDYNEGTHEWYLAKSKAAEHLESTGSLSEAIEIFDSILTYFRHAPSYELFVTLGKKGRCLLRLGRTDLAKTTLEEALVISEAIEHTHSVKRELTIWQTNLADVLDLTGNYEDAQKLYEESLKLAYEIEDFRQAAVIISQLGYLNLGMGRFSESENYYDSALAIFQNIGDEKNQAICWHQKGLVAQTTDQLDLAETYYRKSANISQKIGNPRIAASTWGEIGRMYAASANAAASELWFRKAMQSFKEQNDLLSVEKTKLNIASLLLGQPERLAEAQQLAEESLEFKRKFDPSVMEIWSNYDVLASIVEKSGDVDQSRKYRLLARSAYRNFEGSQKRLERFHQVIEAVTRATGNSPENRPQFNVTDKESERFFNVIKRIWAGERDVEDLCDSVGLEHSLVIETILARLPEQEQSDSNAGFSRLGGVEGGEKDS